MKILFTPLYVAMGSLMGGGLDMFAPETASAVADLLGVYSASMAGAVLGFIGAFFKPSSVGTT